MDQNQPPPPPSTPAPQPEPTHSPSDFERVAHEKYIRTIVEKVSDRIQTLLTTTVMQAGHGDYVIWLMLGGLDRGIMNLVYDADGVGTPLPIAVQLQNRVKIDMLAAVALERYATKLRARLTAGVALIDSPPENIVYPAVDWSARDQALCYDDALEQLGDILPIADETTPPGEESQA